MFGKRCPDLPLRYENTKEPIHRYAFYPRLLTDEPWRVPVLHGRIPANPDENSPLEEKGRFALFILVLFRPWRNLKEEILGLLKHPRRSLTEDRTLPC